MKLLAPLLTLLALTAGAIPSNQLPLATGWQGNVGIPGGIPAPSTRPWFTNFAAGASTAQIQDALNRCTNGADVHLAAGSFTLTALYMTNADNIGLVGATNADGSAATYITASASGGQWLYVTHPHTSIFASSKPGNYVLWTNGFAQGATTLTVAQTNMSLANYTIPAGRLIFLQQLNTAKVGIAGPDSDAIPTQQFTSPANPNDGRDECHVQVAIALTSSGGTITIAHGLYDDQWNASLQPKIWSENVMPATLCRVENLRVTGADASQYGVTFENAYQCWSANCEITGFKRDFYFFETLDCELRRWCSGPSYSYDEYPGAFYYSSGLLVEDGIGHDGKNLGGVYSGLSCCAFFGNALTWTTNTTTDGNLYGGFYLHGYSYMVLQEQNWMPMLAHDNVWGGEMYAANVRNVALGYLSNYTAFKSYINNVQAVRLAATNLYASFEGNLLGTVGTNRHLRYYAGSGNTYWDQTGPNGFRVIWEGYYHNGQSTGGADPNVTNTVTYVANWVSSTNGDQFAGPGIWLNGYTTSSVPTSRLYSSKPAYFANWPAYDPNQGSAASITNIPAGYRLTFGTNPPTGASPPAAPVAAFSGTPRTNAVPFTVTFTDASTGAPTSWAWDFGDGGTSTSQNPTHSYSAAGTNTVTLTVSNAGGSSSLTNVAYIVATNTPAPAPTILYGPFYIKISQAGKNAQGVNLVRLDWIDPNNPPCLSYEVWHGSIIQPQPYFIEQGGHWNLAVDPITCTNWSLALTVPTTSVIMAANKPAECFAVFGRM